MTEPLLRVAELTKAFGATKVVDSLSFEIHPGECLGVIGPNGAGKTTTIRMCLGLTIGNVLPLKAAVDLVRPLVLGEMPADVAQPLLILIGYAAAGYYLALVLTRRRFFR